MKSELLDSAVRLAPWDDATDADLSRVSATMDAPAGVIASELSEARAHSHAILSINGERVGTLVFEVESGEFFVVALVGTRARVGLDLLTIFQPQIEHLARLKGCVSVRYCTSRAGLVERTKRLGYRVSSVVMRKALK